MVDRNQAARDREQAQRELQQQIQKFARAMNEGKTGMVDRFGVKIEAGHYVLYRPMHDLIFEVIDVAPSLNPQHMVGTITLKLACTTDVQFVAGQRAMTVIKCGQRAADEEGAADLKSPGSEPAADQLDARAHAGDGDGAAQEAGGGDDPAAEAKASEAEDRAKGETQS